MPCDLAADAHVVGNFRNGLLCTVPQEGCFGQVVCYEPWRLNWLPVHWTEFKHIHVVITDGHGQKVSFEVRMCLVKLVLRRRVGYLGSENK